MGTTLTSTGRRQQREDRRQQERLARRIRTYWTERGYDVSVEVVEGRFEKVLRGQSFVVRSDMVNGLPVRRSAR